MQKGGVGKSEITLNTADALARRGHQVLVVDLDPQGSPTEVLGLPLPGLSLTDAMLSNGHIDTTDLLVQSEHNAALAGDVHYIPRTVEAFTLEGRLPAAQGREYRLSRVLDAIDVQHPDRFDFCLIDCPPSLGALTDAALVAVRRRDHANHGVLIPVAAEQFCLDALPLLLRQISVLESVLGMDIDIAGLVINRWNEKKGGAVIDLYNTLSSIDGLPVIATIRERTRLMQESERLHTSALVRGPGSDLAGWFDDIAGQLAARAYQPAGDR